MDEKIGAEKISPETIRADFNDPLAVVHYSRAAHFLGLWESERTLIDRYFPDRGAALLEAGCGAGRVSIGLWEMGYRQIVAFDFAEELLDQARSLAAERGVAGIKFIQADATDLSAIVGAVSCTALDHGRSKTPPLQFAGALFMFNGLMQIPGRERRREALRSIAHYCRAGAPILFTTHDRDVSPTEQVMWRLEAQRWARGEQDPRLIEFGDRYFEDEAGRTFMHLPDRGEILEDLAATGWNHEFDALRREVAAESRAVRDFADECRFWVALRKQVER